jgi:hypothetical protein
MGSTGRVPFGMFYVEVWYMHPRAGPFYGPVTNGNWRDRVQVDPHSKVEKLLAIAAMAPYFIMCALTTLIARCRELLICSWLLGHLLNEVLNFVLKRTFKEKRPDNAPAVG